MAINVVEEAKRCLQCKVPMCRKGCPISTNIPEMNRLFLEFKKDEAGKMLFENNPLSAICSLVCNHEKQCEGNCVLGRKSSPVHVSSIENYISDAYLDHLNLQREDDKKQRVAIIGGGPAGITISVILAQRGYDVTIFESRDKIGGVLRYGIPEFRLPKTVLDRYEERLKKLGIKIRPHTVVGYALTIDDLERDGYEAIFIGTGVWRPKKLGIKGESLGNVHFAIDYLANPDVYDLGKRVVIIGAGNSAMDVARTATRKGVSEVYVFCRRGHAAASVRELEYAEADGVQILYGYRPDEFTDNGVLYKVATMDEEDNVLEMSEQKFFEADSIVVAASQGAMNRIVSTTKGIETNEKGLLNTDEKGSTSRPGIFSAGDVVNGARTVVEAVRYSKDVAEAMDEYLKAKREEKENANEDEEVKAS
ncbi:NAD(P)-dependent oxidoreductase [Lachnospira sp.]|jgi:glutamate synthase (NADPH/NADH) small chain|uniref:NAD(P)-dependent oxidoreductase n=1 Tax=Lachnospira sp. TaxID=2049031 RepID=UPI00257D0B1C|nr:NAD(P)-dependent oxidoreductase [Lachnospira sp.]